jgi:hypothetical protein
MKSCISCFWLDRAFRALFFHLSLGATLLAFHESIIKRLEPRGMRIFAYTICNKLVINISHHCMNKSSFVLYDSKGDKECFLI